MFWYNFLQWNGLQFFNDWQQALYNGLHLKSPSGFACFLFLGHSIAVISKIGSSWNHFLLKIIYVVLSPRNFILVFFFFFLPYLLSSLLIMLHYFFHCLFGWTLCLTSRLPEITSFMVICTFLPGFKTSRTSVNELLSSVL